jgi:hypothetical protein
MMLKQHWSKLSTVVCLSSCLLSTSVSSGLGRLSSPFRCYCCRLEVVDLSSHLIFTSIVDPQILDI